MHSNMLESTPLPSSSFTSLTHFEWQRPPTKEKNTHKKDMKEKREKGEGEREREKERRQDRRKKAASEKASGAEVNQSGSQSCTSAISSHLPSRSEAAAPPVHQHHVYFPDLPLPCHLSCSSSHRAPPRHAAPPTPPPTAPPHAGRPTGQAGHNHRPPGERHGPPPPPAPPPLHSIAASSHSCRLVTLSDATRPPCQGHLAVSLLRLRSRRPLHVEALILASW